MNLGHIVALLQAVIVLLTSSMGTPVEPQARQMANQVIVIAQQSIESIQTSQLTQEINQETKLPEYIQQTSPVITQESMTYNLEIISPLPGKGLERKYLSRPQIMDEKNYIELGLLITDESGKDVYDAEVSVEVTDASQNKTMSGTGNVVKIYKNGSPREAHYYPLHYEFRHEGIHAITFRLGGQEISVNLEVGKDNRE